MVGSSWIGGTYAVLVACTIFFIGQAFVAPSPVFGQKIAAPTLRDPAVHGVAALERLEHRGTNTLSFVPLVVLTALMLRSRTACRGSLRGCETLYFRRGLLVYPPRHQKNLRNRAYNLIMKAKYKRFVRLARRAGKELEGGDWTPGSLEKAMEKLKGKMDLACEAIDEACVQGVINRIDAAEQKDIMCRQILKGCIKVGYVERSKDPFIPAFKVLGYEVPECTMVREPRPWQLPGWKSPWMLKREYDRWQRKKREEQAAAEA